MKRRKGRHFKILIINREKRTRLSQPKLARWIRKILTWAGLKRAGLAVVLVNDPGIRRYHRQFLGEDRATDVLAFEARAPFLGDLVVSVETAKRVAPRFGNRWDEELLLYICHGILHLRGWRDSTPSKKAEMEKKQERILEKALGRQWRSKKRKPLF